MNWDEFIKKHMSKGAKTGSIIALAVFFGIFVVEIIYTPVNYKEELNNLSTLQTYDIFKYTYINYHMKIWYFTLLLLTISIVPSLIKIHDKNNSLKRQLVICITLLFLFLFISLYGLSRSPDTTDGHYNIIIGIFSVLSIGLGWVITSQLASKHHRSGHTINIILQQRLSSTFRNDLDVLCRIYPAEKDDKISDDDTKSYIGSPDYKKNNKIQELTSEKKIAIDSMFYLMDFYEFLCLGIESGDLDSDIIFKLIGGNIIRTHKKFLPLISAYRQGDYNFEERPLVYIGVTKYVEDNIIRYIESTAGAKMKQTCN